MSRFFPYFALLLTGLVSLAGTARAEILVTHQEMPGKDPSEKVEVTVYSAETEAEKDQVVSQLKKEFAEDLEKSPNAVRSFERIDLGKSAGVAESKTVDWIDDSFSKISEKTSVYRRILKPQTAKLIEERFGPWIEKQYPYVFGGIRFLVNGSVAFAGYYATAHLPIPVAVAAGLATGAISGSFQTWNNKFQTYFTKSLLRTAFPKAENRVLDGVRKAAIHLEGYGRWYILEIGFVTVIESILKAMGHPTDDDFSTTEKHAAWTAFVTVLSQGTWDIAVSNETKRKLAKAIVERAQNRIQMRADLIGLGVSFVSVTAMTSRILGLDLGWYAFGGLAASGLAYAIKTRPKKAACAAELLPSEPPRSEFEKSVDLADIRLPDER